MSVAYAVVRIFSTDMEFVDSIHRDRKAACARGAVALDSGALAVAIREYDPDDSDEAAAYGVPAPVQETEPETLSPSRTEIFYSADLDLPSYRHIDGTAGTQEEGQIHALDDLLSVLKLDGYLDADMDDLPTFGGAEPLVTSRAWSWDETRLLVGTCGDDFEIVERAAGDGEAGQ